MKPIEVISELGESPRLGKEFFGAEEALRLAQLIEEAETHYGLSEEDLPGLVGEEKAQELVEWAEGVIQARKERRRDRRISRMAIQAGRSSCYGYIYTLQYYTTKEGKSRWMYDPDTRGKGLLQGIIDNIRGNQAPVAIPVLDNRSKADVNEGQGLPGDDEPMGGLPYEQIRNLLDHELYVIQGKWAIPRDGEGFGILKETFPNAVDTTAYAGGLLSPTEPGGLWLNQKVTLTNIPTWAGRPSGRDGSGCIHPSLLAPLDRGIATIQVRGATKNGTFFKGILVPDERCVDHEGNPTIWVDWLQVKGKMKGHAKRFSEKGLTREIVADLGVLRVWDRPSTISVCFEILENIRNTEANWEVVRDRLDQAMDRMEEKGLEGFAKTVARDNPSAALAIQLINLLNEKKGAEEYSALSIPWLRRAVEDKIMRRLYHLGQGAGMAGERFVTIIDNGIPPGHCVVPGIPAGKEVAAFRIPVVLSQVLTTMKTVAPLPWHRTGTGLFECEEWMRGYNLMLEARAQGNHGFAEYIQGQLIQRWYDGIEEGRYSDGDPIPYTVFLNEVDMVNRMMGDDDGDTIGIFRDPEVVGLFKDLVDDKVYLVEPEGEKVELLWDNPKTWERYGMAPWDYMAQDQRGPVGELTILRSRLLAVGDIMGALAMSILIQEAIDKGKRVVRWTDWRFAVFQENWHYSHEKGGWEFEPTNVVEFEDSRGIKQTPRSRVQTDEFGNIRMGPVYGWVNDRLKAFGVPTTTTVDQWGNAKEKPVYTCGWRRGRWQQDKRIHPDHWEPAEAHQDGWTGGNLVHRCWNHARERWLTMKDRFDTKIQQVDLSTLLHELVRLERGIDIPIKPMTWDEYVRGLRVTSGIQALGKAMAKAQSTKGSPDTKNQRHDEALAEFRGTIQRCGVEDLMQIWYMECKYSRHQGEDFKGNINYAYYAVAWDGSPVLALLGLDMPARCGFLDQDPTREKQILDDCFKHQDPIKRLGVWLAKSRLHGQENVDEAGEPVEMWSCPDCTDRLQRGVIRRIRRDKSRLDRKWMSQLTHRLNNPNKGK